MSMKEVKFIILLFIVATIYPQEKIPVTFTLYSKQVDSVFVAGSFNNWSGSFNPLTKQNDSTWVTTLYLNPGYYYYKFVVNNQWIPDPENEWKINDGGDNFNSIVKVGDPPRPKREKSEIPFPKQLVPEPVLENDRLLIDLYYAAWEMAWNKIKRGTTQNGFVQFYMDEGFNELIYQWDTIFMAAFGMYASNLFPAIQSLDNFYNKQRNDGYIQRVYWESNGQPANEPTLDEPMINPPLFAWMEWRYYNITGDKSRLKKVLPNITKYYDWINNNLRDSVGQGLYYTTQLGSGMDNIPRPIVGKAGWIDLTAQMALAAKMIINISAEVGDNKTVLKFTDEYSRITSLLNQLCWDEDKQFYFDLREDAKLSTVMHIGGFWTLLSETATRDRAEALFKHLANPDEFWRPHMIPTLAANQPMYDSSGHYWLGGVWAPTNYMVIKGLEKYGQYDLANQIADNHINKIAEVFFDFEPDEEKIAFEERYGDGYKTIWECYSPEFTEPATRWDNTFYSRQDFVGWSGLGPIALLIENIIGIDMDVPKNQITWRINRTDKHGIKNLNYLDGKVSLLVETVDDHLSFNITSTHSFNLQIIHNSQTINRKINAGSNLFIIE